MKKLVNDFVLRSSRKSFLYHDALETECSIIVKNFICPDKDKPAKIMKIPASISNEPFAILLNIATPPRKPNIAPKIT